MMNHDIHVHHQDGSGWVVKRCGTSSALLGNFRRRALAEAYGRALAHRSQVELVVHRPDGKQVRYPAYTLSYSASLS
jgi:hypothetical protein